MASINFLQGSEWIYWFLGVSERRNESCFFFLSPSRVIYRAGLFLCFGLILIIPVYRIWPLVSLIDGWKSLWRKLDFCVYDSVGPGGGSSGQTDPVRLAPLSHRKTFEKMPATAQLEVQGLLCPSLALSFLLFLPMWFSLPLFFFLISSKYLLKSQDVETPEGSGPGLTTWYAAHKPGVDALQPHTCMQAFSSWQWHSDSSKEAQTKTLPDVCTRLLCPFILSSLTFVAHFISHHLSPTVETPPFHSTAISLLAPDCLGIKQTT